MYAVEVAGKQRAQHWEVPGRSVSAFLQALAEARMLELAGERAEVWRIGLSLTGRFAVGTPATLVYPRTPHHDAAGVTERRDAAPLQLLR